MLTLEDVVRLGRRFAHSASDSDNEVQEVFAVRSDLPARRVPAAPGGGRRGRLGAAGRRDRAVRRVPRRGRGRRAAARRPAATPVEVTIAGFAAGERAGYPALALRGLRRGARRADPAAVRAAAPALALVETATGSPTAIEPPARMSARSPARCTSGRRIPGRVNFSRCAQGSASLRPTHSAEPILNRRPTSALSEIPRVTTLRRPCSQDRSTVIERLRLDESELVPAAGPAERAAALVVAVADEPSSGDGLTASTRTSGCLGLRRDQERRDGARGRVAAVRLLDRQPEVEPREQPPRHDRPAARESRVRIVHRPRRGAEHDDGVVALRGADAGDPGPGHVELVAHRRSARARGCARRATA